MKIEKLKMTRMHNLFIIALSAMCIACGGKNQGRQQTVPEFAVITLQPETVKLTSAYPATFKGRQDVEIRPNVSGFITKPRVSKKAKPYLLSILFNTKKLST